jgi:hypothetical protein
MRIEYAGWRPSADDHTIPRLSAATITPEAFFRDHVAARRPAVIARPSTTTDDAAAAARQLGLPLTALATWTHNEPLRRSAGTCPVLVERRRDADDVFGRGRRVPMPLSALLDAIAAGDSTLYLTAQELPPARGGRVAPVAAPMDALLAAHGASDAVLRATDGDPRAEQQRVWLRPSIMGRLVPQQVNLWMGHTQQHETGGASSGLHHDFHDNLYCLVRGRKRFYLFPPSDAPKMYLHGRVQLVHPNGRIVYAPEDDSSRTPAVRADGATMELRLRDARRSLNEARSAAAAASALADMERLLAEARALGLSIEADSDDDDDDDDDNNSQDSHASDDNEEVDDEEDNDDETGARFDSDGNDDDDDDDDDAALQAALASGGPDSSADDDSEEDTHAESNVAESAQLPDGGEVVDSTTPPSFSRAHRFDHHDPAEFPLLATAQRSIVDIEPGDLLYLPAGWFHEVLSFGGEPSGESAGHLAVNYWFHPPDTTDFQAPYSDNLWEREWRRAGLPADAFSHRASTSVRAEGAHPPGKRARRQ